MSKYRAYHGVVNVCGPSSFFTKNLFYIAGGIDERYHYTMDTDLWLRYALNQRKIFRPFIKYAWGLRLHPDAKMSGHKFSGNGEILEGKKSISAFKNNLKRLEQINKEEEWTNEKVVFNIRSIPKIMQLLSADYIPALFSRIDTRLYKGRKLSEIRSFR